MHKVNANTYRCGEEVLYKNKDHVKKGVSVKVQQGKKSNNVIYNTKFRDNRRVMALEDIITSNDETHVSILLEKAQDFVNNSKCLTVEEVQMIRKPPIISPLENEWKVVHDQYGHLPFAMWTT